MLVRQAARSHGRLRGKCFKVACRQLHLPWLCPAYTQSFASPSRCFTIDAGSQASSLRKRTNSKDGTSSPPKRSLATAVDTRPFNNDIPFETVVQHRGRAEFEPMLTGSPPTHGIASFDPTSTLVLRKSPGFEPQRIRYYKGIGGDLDDIISILDACLQVGRMERARVIMKRIFALQVLGPEAMVGLHNEYIKASLLRLMERSSDSAAQELHKWFEMEIRNKGLPITAETITYMLRASLQAPEGRKERLVRRYMDMGGLEVLGLMEAEEQAHITGIVQDYNYPMAEIDFDDNIAETEQLNITTTKIGDTSISELSSNPSVRPVEIKGLGLKTLKQSLSLFSDKPLDFNSDHLDHHQRRERQEQLERDAVSSAIDRWRDENVLLTKMGVDTTLETKSLGSRMWKWQGELEAHIKEEQKKVDIAEISTLNRSIADNERCSYGPFLRLLSPERLAAVTILSTMTNLSGHGASKGLPLASGIMAIGSSVEDETATESILKTYGKDVLKNLGRGQIGGINRMLKRKQYQAVADSLEKLSGHSNTNASSAQNSLWGPQWSTNIRGKVGAFLMSALIETAKIPVKKIHPETGEELIQMQPAFSHAYQYKLGKKQGVVLANPALISQLHREPVHSLLAKHLPMLAEPEPWSDFNVGGFLVHPAKVMRIKLGDKDQRHYAEAAIEKGDMAQMFKGLGVLGKTSWRINKQVFNTMLAAWNDGTAIANFPPADPDLQVPPEPEPSQDPAVRRQWMNAVKAIENTRGGYHSQRCFQNFQLEIARALRDEVFYFPHNIDFRGRAYPIPPYLNHMGADHCRGLLRFGKGKELGVNGLKWLKIHLANVYGYDKASLLERELFAVNHLKEIYDSASNPLQGARWWLKAEDPWQCLAACFELKDALDSPDPAKFLSHLPIHQDGTCNGLQHYAALGGDEWGAKQVNLTPGDRPADVYSAVADLVKESIAVDLQHGNPYAKVLDGKITRKVVKQTVMTNVYGVTFVGARAQVRKQLEAAYPDLPNTPTMHPGLLSSYIATKIFQALSSMFSGAHDIQYWLGECANRISQVVAPEQIDVVRDNLSIPGTASGKSLKKIPKKPAFSIEEHLQFKSSVIWTSPLRMPVVQPYRASKTRTIATNLQRVHLSDPHASDPVSKRKQLQGFPPNFVHSLDASHMMLSALKCDELGLTFAAVHDSFWTHATDIDSMNGVLRDAFINIHSEDVIGRLAAEFNARYKGGMYLAKIKPHSRLGIKIHKFRKSKESKASMELLNGLAPVRDLKTKELLIERERIRLLESSDPKEVEEGRKIVTAGSIFEELSAEEDLEPPEGLEFLTLGQIPHSESKSRTVEGENFGMSSLEDLHNPLPGGTAADVALSEDDVSVDQTKTPKIKAPFADMILGTKSQRHVAWQWAWLPFRLPPVPKKGSFDVSQLKNSEYFFS